MEAQFRKLSYVKELVLHGSVLGPVLFSLSDLHTVIHYYMIHSCTDDTQLCRKRKIIIQKSAIISFKSKHGNFNYGVIKFGDGTELSHLSHSKNLGIASENFKIITENPYGSTFFYNTRNLSKLALQIELFYYLITSFIMQISV